MSSERFAINAVISKINEAASAGTGLTLSEEDIKYLNDLVGDIVVIPHYTMDEVAQLHREGKLGNRINEKES